MVRVGLGVELSQQYNYRCNYINVFLKCKYNVKTCMYIIQQSRGSELVTTLNKNRSIYMKYKKVNLILLPLKRLGSVKFLLFWK